MLQLRSCTTWTVGPFDIKPPHNHNLGTWENLIKGRAYIVRIDAIIEYTSPPEASIQPPTPP